MVVQGRAQAFTRVPGGGHRDERGRCAMLLCQSNEWGVYKTTACCARGGQGAPAPHTAQLAGSLLLEVLLQYKGAAQHAHGGAQHE
jgi:hypothetical protein